MSEVKEEKTQEETKVEESASSEDTVVGGRNAPRSITDIVKDLSQPIPDKFLKTKKLGGTNITFITWHDCTRFLDVYAPGWTKEIVSIQSIKDKVVMSVRLSIPSLEGDIYREATGNEDDVTSSYGDAFSNSEAMALKRAAANFGLGRHLYRGEK